MSANSELRTGRIVLAALCRAIVPGYSIRSKSKVSDDEAVAVQSSKAGTLQEFEHCANRAGDIVSDV
ncbi:MAG TPA: hypothetical protein VE641_18585 [Chthoniobacterales bacterium]|nr:hypothetical protein [Chthoniobacterales bacterium]